MLLWMQIIFTWKTEFKMYPSGSPRWVQPWLKTMKQLLMLSTELLFTQTSHLCFLRWHSTEHQRYRSDPVDLQWGRFCAEGSDGSVPGGTACHPDRLRGHGGGRRGCRQGRTGPCGRPTRRRPQLGAAVDSLAWITQVESDSDSDSDSIHLNSLPLSECILLIFIWKTQLWLCPCCFSHMHWCRDIVLQKTNNESWGFSIVGGYEESHGQQPFFIKTIVPGTPAHFDGRLK